MNPVTVNDLNAITQLAYSALIIGLILSFFLFTLLRNIALSIIKRINFPHRVKTEQGYLYRSFSGTYVTKQRADDIKIERKMKRKNHFIKYHEHVLKRLKS